MLEAGNLVSQQRFVPVGDVEGWVLPDGTVELEPVQFYVDVRSVALPSINLGDCLGEPFSVQFEGTADAEGLHLTADDFRFGAAPPASCHGLGDTINLLFADLQVDLEVSVAGDFTPPAVVTETVVRSWFDEVAQHNQTILTAQVSHDGSAPVSSGTVEFRDGDDVLATAPVRNGVASAVAFMSSPGERTITATYSGAPGREPSSATTSLVVTPVPIGRGLVGGMSVNGWEVAPGASGVVIGPLGPGGTASWLPVTLEGDVGGGPSSAEVRLLPLGALTAEKSGVRGTYWLHLRSITRDGATTTPLGCLSVVTVDYRVDGSGDRAVVSGSAVPLGTGWGCRTPLATAWTDALAGEVTGTLALAD